MFVYSKPVNFYKLGEHFDHVHPGDSAKAILAAISSEMAGHPHTGDKLQTACPPAPTSKDPRFFDSDRVFSGKARSEPQPVIDEQRDFDDDNDAVDGEEWSSSADADM